MWDSHFGFYALSLFSGIITDWLLYTTRAQFINDVDSSKLFSLNNLTLAAFKPSIKISSWNAFKQNWVKNIELVGIWPIVSAYRL